MWSTDNANCIDPLQPLQARRLQVQTKSVRSRRFVKEINKHGERGEEL